MSDHSTGSARLSSPKSGEAPPPSLGVDLDEWVVRIGEIVASHGRIGALRVRLLTDFPERFLALKEVCVILPSGEKRLEEVVEAQVSGRGVRLRLAGVSGIGEAQTYRGGFLTVRLDMRVELPEDTYFVEDLIGLRILTTAGQDLGTVREVLHLPANDVYVSEKALIPAVKDVVAEVSLSERVIRVHPIEGLAPEAGI